MRGDGEATGNTRIDAQCLRQLGDRDLVRADVRRRDRHRADHVGGDHDQHPRRHGQVDAEGEAEEREHADFDEPDRERQCDRLRAQPRVAEDGEAVDEVRHGFFQRQAQAAGKERHDATTGPAILQLDMRERDDGEQAASHGAQDAPEDRRREVREIDERQADQPQHREGDAVEQRLSREDGGSQAGAAHLIALRRHLHPYQVADARRHDVVRQVRDEENAEERRQRQVGKRGHHDAPALRHEQLRQTEQGKPGDDVDVVGIAKRAPRLLEIDAPQQQRDQRDADGDADEQAALGEARHPVQRPPGNGTIGLASHECITLAGTRLPRLSCA